MSKNIIINKYTKIEIIKYICITKESFPFIMFLHGYIEINKSWKFSL